MESPSSHALVVIAFLILGLSAATTNAQVISEDQRERIDVPLTKDNSILYEINDGVVFRIPKILVPTVMLPKEQSEHVKNDYLKIIFQYPEMTLTGWPSQMQIIFEKGNGSYKPRVHEFPVYIKWLFHSHEKFNVDSDTQYASKGWEWRPITHINMVKDGVRNDAKKHGIKNAEAKPMQSEFKGLLYLDYPITDPAYHEKLVQAYGVDPSLRPFTTIYTVVPEAPYELYMNCASPSTKGPESCEAYVYIKKNHLQYTMQFPPEAVSNTSALIDVVNDLVSGWVLRQARD